MCGRYSQGKPVEELRSQLRYEFLDPGVVPRLNIAPSQPAAVLVAMDGKRQLRLLRWGLVPFWAKTESGGPAPINTRSETIAEKYAPQLKSRRCLVPADGFYEWTREGRLKQPFRFTLRDQGLFCFAGIWDSWRKPDGTDLETFSILTTSANALVAPVHDRMPVILDEPNAERWIAQPEGGKSDWQSVLQPFSPDRMKSCAVNSAVNSPNYEGPLCIEPVLAQASLF
jgi:putative SOS response-associated peptidase YedK